MTVPPITAPTACCDTPQVMFPERLISVRSHTVIPEPIVASAVEALSIPRIIELAVVAPLGEALRVQVTPPAAAVLLRQVQHHDLICSVLPAVTPIDVTTGLDNKLRLGDMEIIVSAVAPVKDPVATKMVPVDAVKGP